MGARLWVYLASALVLFVVTSGSRVFGDEDDRPVNRFRQNDFLHDVDHMAEHTRDMPGIDPSSLTGEEKEFYFFKLHDFNNDNRLDGLEIMASLRHGMRESYARSVSRGGSEQEMKARLDKIHARLTLTVDIILREDDVDDDGYLTYTEFRYARRAKVFLKHGEDENDVTP